MNWIKALCLFGLAYGLMGFGLELNGSASLFEQPSLASKQLSILKGGEEITLSGPATEAEGQKWIPVTTESQKGWVLASTLKEDVDFSSPIERQLRIWFGGGAMQVEGPESSNTIRLAIGSEKNWFSRFFVGGYLSKGFVTENYSTTDFLGNPETGTFNTFSVFFPYLSFYAIPESLWVRGALGVTHVNSTSGGLPNRLTNSFSVAIGYKLTDLPGLRIGAELSYEYRGGNFFIDIGHDLLGSYPKASLYSLSLILDKFL